MRKAAKEKTEKKRIGAVVFKLAVAVAAVYLIGSFISGQIQVAAKQRELDEISAKVELQVEKNRELQRLMENDDEEAYIERVAREQLGYARSKERVFIDLTGQ